MRSRRPRPCLRGWTAAALALLIAAGTAFAHGLGMSQLQLHVDGPRVFGEWDLHLHDARLLVGLDPALAGESGFVDLRLHEDSLRTLLAGRLALASDSASCPVEVTPDTMEWHADQGFVRLRVAARCPTPPTRLGVHCDLLFDRDPNHRAYFSVEDARVISVGVFRNDLRSVTLEVRQFRFWATLFEFIGEGIRHIGSGVDHVLFLVALLLPSVVVRAGADWLPRPGFWAAAREVVKVVTAFTLAHSITLCLSFFGLVTLRSNWVEAAIALSVFAAAWNNLRPFLPGRAWAIALSFGLVHGMGFAGALRNLSLPRHARGLALGAFNVGVEIGQLSIVAVVLPLLYAASRKRWYPRLVMGFGSLVIAWMGLVWAIERGFGLTLIPRK